ncbi:PIG-L deacetylase family protein [Actinomadura rupiterrae]|uniref:PIG-L deacetylase family protein n=1 Tax=Actinomadura rupiterrae TaxID=559627 RepID=UPI0020A4FBD8|nr:PIG-L deacetylase family protein [Actinomadura rupiterrae]MCP2335761.1 4-oxalomesaconate hydratase [Actinomadura rupiterrae]
MSDGPVLIVSAHAADFVWRAGGYAALPARRGIGAHVVCLSYGERGESAALWKSGASLEQVKAARRAEAEAAARVLGAEITFLDAGDYPLPRADEELMDALVQRIRAVRPGAVLVHSATDPYNADHPRAAELALEARVLAQAEGYPSEHPVIGAPPVFRFEPHQPEMCGFRPDVLVDITEVFDAKREAMECMNAQEHLWDYYTDLARRRGVQAVRNGADRAVRYAEAYQRVYPQVAGVLA